MNFFEHQQRARQRTTLAVLLFIVAVLAIAGPWMMTTLVEYLQRTLQAIPGAVG